MYDIRQQYTQFQIKFSNMLYYVHTCIAIFFFLSYNSVSTHITNQNQNLELKDFASHLSVIRGSVSQYLETFNLQNKVPALTFPLPFIYPWSEGVRHNVEELLIFDLQSLSSVSELAKPGKRKSPRYVWLYFCSLIN